MHLSQVLKAEATLLGQDVKLDGDGLSACDDLVVGGTLLGWD